MSKKTESPFPESITAEQLAAWANLTTRRLSQLGQEGKIPAPAHGKYALPETVQRLFAYYQYEHEKISRERLLKLKAEREMAQRKNAIEKGLADETVMLTADHFRIVSAIIGRIEQVPGKLASEQGLTPAQTLALRKALDDARETAAKEIEEMRDEG